MVIEARIVAAFSEGRVVTRSGYKRITKVLFCIKLWTLLKYSLK